MDVGVICAGLLDHAAELGVTVGAEHGENAAHGPDDQGKINGTGTRETFLSIYRMLNCYFCYNIGMLICVLVLFHLTSF